MIIAYILVFTALSSIFSLIGSIFLLIKKQLTETFSNQIINFAAGVLIATAFLDLFPEAQEVSKGASIFLPALIGFIAFFFAERFIQWFHTHHQHGQEPKVLLILIGDGIHNFIDGIAITTTFLTNINLGIMTSIAVAAHEIPQEIADMSVLLACGLGRAKALLLNFLSALTALLGAILAYLFASFLKENMHVFLSLTAGLFIYISASDLIPLLHEKYLENKKLSPTLTFLFGILIVFIMGTIFET